MADHKVSEFAEDMPAAVVEETPVVEKETFPQIGTVGFDARFPNQNQTKNCWQNYVDYHRCVKREGEDFAPCYQFKRAFTILCPTPWVEKWDDQRSNNVFPALVEKKEHSAHH